MTMVVDERDPPEEMIREHMRFPYHEGHLDQPMLVGAGRNPSCGDEVRFELSLCSWRRIQEAYFSGRGCALSRAAASILCEFVEGQSTEALAAFSRRDMLTLVGVPLTPQREQCVLLPLHVLHSMLNECVSPADAKPHR